MGTNYLSPDAPRVGRSLFIATPAYEAVKPGFAYSLAMTTAELVRHHIPFELGIMEGNCHVDDGRNSLVRDFLEGNCTDMLFIDSDLMWSAKDVVRILAHKDDLVCGAYPKKCSPASYPIGRIFDTRHDGMLSVSFAPTGFMRISRKVFEALLPTQSKFGRQRPTAVFFERRFNGKTRDGGDVTFCRKAIQAGFKVMVDPHIQFSHIGETRWSGKFIEYLANDENRAKHFDQGVDPNGLDDPRSYVSEERYIPDSQTADVPFWIARIREGNDGDEAFESLCEAYGNQPFAGAPEFQKLAWQMARNLPEGSTILECGSGLSTAVLAAAGHKVVAIEEHKEWAEKTQALLDSCGLDADIIVSPMNGQWYAAKEPLRGLEAKMVVIDGPRRRAGISRVWPLSTAAAAIYVTAPDAAILMDDVKEPPECGEWVKMGTEERPFAAGRLSNPVNLAA